MEHLNEFETTATSVVKELDEKKLDYLKSSQFLSDMKRKLMYYNHYWENYDSDQHTISTNF